MFYHTLLYFIIIITGPDNDTQALAQETTLSLTDSGSDSTL